MKGHTPWPSGKATPAIFHTSLCIQHSYFNKTERIAKLCNGYLNNRLQQFQGVIIKQCVLRGHYTKEGENARQRCQSEAREELAVWRCQTSPERKAHGDRKELHWAFKIHRRKLRQVIQWRRAVEGENLHTLLQCSALLASHMDAAIAEIVLNLTKLVVSSFCIWSLNMNFFFSVVFFFFLGTN